MKNSELNSQSGYGFVYQSVMRNKYLSIETKAIYAYLSSFAGNKDECYPNAEMIFKELGICRNSFYKYLKILVNLGVIKKQKRKNGNKWANTIYKISHLVDIEDTKIEDTKIEDTKIEDIQN